ncbi:ATP-dependent zinc protease [Halioglobus maricola]|uniref:ATP-dependent zinc protease n=1 Tax=Halioglobus maricola TaxID=2601894 RepID=A0A5P9NFX1_9GAMM|nr:ATP-dependent zinc protease [Halioglobus maricola]QFU74419.1 ATP-dependent zinc protease [Halioglobus maricola]
MSGSENTLGWREWLSFPELGIAKVKAKVDTGARTSCLHAYVVEPFERQGVAWVRFGIHPEQDDTETEVICEAIVKDRRSVRDSGGHEEIRYVIDTEVLIGGQSQRVEVTLTDRDTMKFRCLLGRSAIRGKYLVDPAQSYLQGRRKRVRQRPQ